MDLGFALSLGFALFLGLAFGLFFALAFALVLGFGFGLAFAFDVALLCDVASAAPAPAPLCRPFTVALRLSFALAHRRPFDLVCPLLRDARPSVCRAFAHDGRSGLAPAPLLGGVVGDGVGAAVGRPAPVPGPVTEGVTLGTATGPAPELGHGEGGGAGSGAPIVATGVGAAGRVAGDGTTGVGVETDAGGAAGAWPGVGTLPPAGVGTDGAGVLRPGTVTTGAGRGSPRTRCRCCDKPNRGSGSIAWKATRKRAATAAVATTTSTRLETSALRSARPIVGPPIRSCGFHTHVFGRLAY